MPRYRSVAGTMRGPGATGSAPVRRRPPDTTSQQSFGNHEARYRGRRLLSAYGRSNCHTTFSDRRWPTVLVASIHRPKHVSVSRAQSMRQSPPSPRPASARSARARASRKGPRCTSGHPAAVCAQGKRRHFGPARPQPRSTAMIARSRRPFVVAISGASGSACVSESQFPERTPFDQPLPSARG